MSSLSIHEVLIRFNSEANSITKIFFCSGFNNFGDVVYKFSSYQDSVLVNITTGLYTVYTYRLNSVRDLRNIVVDENTTEITLLPFPNEFNQGFTTVLSSINSSLHVEFNSSPSMRCEVNLALPRCGGTRVLYTEYGEIAPVAEISASIYLVYVKSADFSKDHIAFYTKGFDLPHFTIEGRKGRGFWMLYCINGRKGVNSIQVVDEILENLEPDFCSTFYGNETWSDEEMLKGKIQVEL